MSSDLTAWPSSSDSRAAEDRLSRAVATPTRPAPRKTAAGVRDSRNGIPLTWLVELSGIATAGQYPRCLNCGSRSAASSIFSTRPAATCASCSSAIAVSAS